MHTKESCPPYFGDGSKNIAGCAWNNPLGSHAVWFSGFIYGIHGTNQPALIAPGTKAKDRFVSGGCVRSNNRDIRNLHNKVIVKYTLVNVVSQF